MRINNTVSLSNIISCDYISLIHDIRLILFIRIPNAKWKWTFSARFVFECKFYLNNSCWKSTVSWCGMRCRFGNHVDGVICLAYCSGTCRFCKHIRKQSTFYSHIHTHTYFQTLWFDIEGGVSCTCFSHRVAHEITLPFAGSLSLLLQSSRRLTTDHLHIHRRRVTRGSSVHFPYKSSRLKCLNLEMNKYAGEMYLRELACLNYCWFNYVHYFSRRKLTRITKYMIL